MVAIWEWKVKEEVSGRSSIITFCCGTVLLCRGCYYTKWDNSKGE